MGSSDHPLGPSSTYFARKLFSAPAPLTPPAIPAPAPAATPATAAKAASAMKGLPGAAKAGGTIGDSGPQGITDTPKTGTTLLGGTR